MRPRTLDEFVGQEHFLGPGKLLRRMLEADRLGSLIFYGPPGTGKTALAHVIALHTKSRFVTLNATASGIYVGSRADFEALNAFLSEHQIKPVVDKVFELTDAPAAFEAMDNGDFFGKVVIRL